MKKSFFFFLILIFAISNISYSQFIGYKYKGGVQYDIVSPSGEFKANLSSFLVRGFFAIELGKYVDVEISGGYMKWKQKDHIFTNEEPVEADLIPIDLRLRLEPFANKMKTVNPYLYLGIGMVNYNLKTYPPITAFGTPESKWSAYVPVGLGLEVKLANQFLLDLHGGAATTFTDLVNNVKIGDPNDGWFNFGLGFTFTGKSGRSDTDKDGLYDDDEEDVYKTDPENPDTDGDGLKDGEEVKTYGTNPLDPDSDKDGLKDGEEVKTYNTKPNNPDTDGDGLNDGDEIMKYKTDPLKNDTDGDGLYDGDEVIKYKTNPLMKDTDGDGLTDGEEVLKWKTDPLKRDTDNGSIEDGTEVTRGTNPLDPSDDVKKEEFKVGQVIILDGINFETNSSNITPESETVLMKAYNTLINNPEIQVEISGHTDSRGSDANNQRLSESRANSVKNWLVAKGIAENRITTIGYGESMPIAPNDTQDNMLKNRRIEFKRTK